MKRFDGPALPLVRKWPKNGGEFWHTMKFTAIYLRVSTTEQNVRSQKQAVLEYCERRGWKSRVTFSETESGAKTRRPQLEMMLQAARRGEIARIVAYKLDRLGRSAVHLALILEELARLKIPVVFTSQGIDTSEENPVGKLQLGVLMAFAEFEREMIRERTREGQAAARKRGSVFGRPPTARRHAERVLEMQKAGRSVRQTAAELGISPSSVARMRAKKTAAR